MNFAKFYPLFNPFSTDPFPTDLKPDASIPSQIKDLFLDKEINSLFEELATVNQENLPSKKDDLLEKCDKLINYELLRPKRLPYANDLSRLAVLSMFAVKMKIYQETGDEQGIRRNYNHFARMIDDGFSIARNVPVIFLKDVSDLRKTLVPYLKKPLKIKDETSPNLISVPDMLASSTYVSGTINKNEIREIYNELWQVPSLRPLLTVSAYQVMQKDNPLRIFLVIIL